MWVDTKKLNHLKHDTPHILGKVVKKQYANLLRRKDCEIFGQKLHVATLHEPPGDFLCTAMSLRVMLRVFAIQPYRDKVVKGQTLERLRLSSPALSKDRESAVDRFP
jgi:hypothetical protein